MWLNEIVKVPLHDDIGDRLAKLRVPSAFSSTRRVGSCTAPAASHRFNAWMLQTMMLMLAIRNSFSAPIRIQEVLFKHPESVPITNFDNKQPTQQACSHSPISLDTTVSLSIHVMPSAQPKLLAAGYSSRIHSGALTCSTDS